ncbi:hypothetical protein PFICI_03213 [Pestalotiopsis fici W106-1]|uniref:Uncharacterized protein n=1 Tax=Pestalotiopsis fici (strain W106-1 / CGMCC3.15140) TaxID=1229662 RepID=W3XGG9_PESFW|nr:uncharacterized protein PFICI_03213 [Pestalotiopsis fici W106-1]ETS85188.1 hypothetical protein PFICI_03213 [Pestalotiopsis fici W106-1]
MRPEHGIEVVDFFFAAGSELQMNPLGANNEFKKTGKSSDGKFLNVLVKNNGDERTVSSNQAVDAWIREWVGCEHGGERSYDDKLDYTYVAFSFLGFHGDRDPHVQM